MDSPLRDPATGPTEIHVYWSPLTTDIKRGGSAIVSYHLQFDDGTNLITWTDVIGLTPDSLATSVVVSSTVVSGTVYGFRVRARNIFGWGPYSAVSYIKAARMPATPLAPVTSINVEDGGVAVAWTAPDARGSPITNYTIVIKASDGTWAEALPYCDGSNATVIATLRCVVPMATLTAAPFSYAFDQLVLVKVRATNDPFGAGDYSPESDATGAKIRRVPDKMAAPFEDPFTCTDTQITMKWVRLTGSNAGNSAVVSYTLSWGLVPAGGINDPATDTNTQEADANVDAFTVTGVTGGASYRFRVRARNIYGAGEYSDYTLVVPDDAPGVTAVPTVALPSTTSTSVEITWPQPDDHSSPIRNYTIQFLQANG